MLADSLYEILLDWVRIHQKPISRINMSRAMLNQLKEESRLRGSEPLPDSTMYGIPVYVEDRDCLEIL